MLIKDCMTREVAWIAPDVSLRDAGRRMKEEEIGCLPVGENDRLVGMITDHDIVCRAVAEGRDPTKTTAREVMSNGITWCYEDQSVGDAVHLMTEKQIHHLPVMTRNKRLAGIISLSDLARRGGDLPGEFLSLLARDANRHVAARGRPH